MQNSNSNAGAEAQQSNEAEVPTSSSHNAKTLVSGALQDFMDEVEYMMGLYGKQRYTQAEAQRDKLAEKLDDIMRLGGNDR
jgi:hypothetical protein